MQKAGFGRRLAALLIDGLVTAATLVPAFLALSVGPTQTVSCRVENGEVVVNGGPANALCTGPTAGTWAVFAVLVVGAMAAWVVHVVRGEGRQGQTLGARALGIRVVDVDTGAPIGPARAVLRWMARIVSALACLVGFLWMLGDRDRQTWHDKVTRSVVVVTT